MVESLRFSPSICTCTHGTGGSVLRAARLISDSNRPQMIKITDGQKLRIRKLSKHELERFYRSHVIKIFKNAKDNTFMFSFEKRLNLKCEHENREKEHKNCGSEWKANRGNGN